MSSDAKRKNHYTKKKLEKALHFANVLKINEEKCALIARLFLCMRPMTIQPCCTTHKEILRYKMCV